MTIDINTNNNNIINLILTKPIKKQHSQIPIKKIYRNKYKFIHEFSYYYYNVSKNQLKKLKSQKMIQTNTTPSKQSQKDIYQKNQLQQSNPFKLQVNQMQMSNPFKMNNNNQLQLSNPFEMNLGNGDKTSLFQDKTNQKQPQMFNIIIREQNNVVGKLLAVQPKLIRSQSKQESNHSQQNIKKYKQILRTFYNRRYCDTVKNFEQLRRKNRKQTVTQNSSQEMKKPQAFFKATRLAFNKQNKAKTNIYQKLQQYYLVSKIKQLKSIVIYQLKQPNIRNLKPITISLTQTQHISNSIQYDILYGRIFYFSNIHQQIVVLGTKAKQLICRVKLKYQRINPLLYINKYKSNLYLLVVGGYSVLNNSSIVQGCKFIQIFRIDKWQISLKQVVLRLGIGRIAPIIFSSDHENQQSIFIIGGCSNASLNTKKQIIFNLDQDINFSTNQTAVKIDSSFIQDCFQTDQFNSLLINNINVRFHNPLQLYGGTVLYRKLARTQKYQLFLPYKNCIYTIKTLKNDIHIIQSELAVQNMSNGNIKNGQINRQIGYHRDSNYQYQLYQINTQGQLILQHVYLNQQKNQKKKDQGYHCILM